MFNFPKSIAVRKAQGSQFIPDLRAAVPGGFRGKPVIAYKLGRSSAAAEMATTHTGALAGEDDIADAFLKDLGIVRVDMLETLFEVFPLAQKVPLQSHSMAGKRIGVVTTARSIDSAISLMFFTAGLPPTTV